VRLVRRFRGIAIQRGETDGMLQRCINDLIGRGVLPDEVRQWRELKGGTNSTIGVLGTASRPEQYVIKLNSMEVIARETRFLQLYAGIALLPAVRFVDPALRYFVYDFVPGDEPYMRGNKKALLSALAADMIRHYVRAEDDGPYEWVESPDHGAETIRYSASVIGSRLGRDDHELAAAVQRERSVAIGREERYVLHGDFGVHNFLFADGKLTGVIDPLPAAGRKRYDLLYAFCSSPDELTLPVLLRAVSEAEEEEAPEGRGLIGDVLVALYSRIATCLCHHPADCPQYLQAWKDWKAMYAGA